MTTKEEVRKKVIELLDDMRPHLIEKTDHLLDSGVIDFKNDPGNWELPKDIVQALAKELDWQYKRLYPTRRNKKRIEKFWYHMHFLCQ